MLGFNVMHQTKWCSFQNYKDEETKDPFSLKVFTQPLNVTDEK